VHRLLGEEEQHGGADVAASGASTGPATTAARPAGSAAAVTARPTVVAGPARAVESWAVETGSTEAGKVAPAAALRARGTGSCVVVAPSVERAGAEL
jgi:hypothetical protein